MPPTHRSGDKILLFHLGESYLFKQYFEGTSVFDRLKDYYDRQTYRFEIPDDSIDRVRSILEEAGYEPIIVEDAQPYCVVKEQYTPHADILRNSVVHWERDGHLFFIMKDDASVELALQAGANRLEETSFVLGL